jgi:hypothetical protein
MKNSRLAWISLGATAAFLQACGGGAGAAGGGGGHAGMDLVQVSNGFGQLLPHTVLRLDANGNPTTIAIPIRTNADLVNNVTPLNPVLPVVQYPQTAVLPSGLTGDHFIYAQFDHDVDITSILDSSVSAQTGGGLTGTMTLVALDPASGQSEEIPVRVFVNGYTYAGTPPADDPDHLPLQHWVDIDSATGAPEALDVDGATPGAGFPGTPGYEFSGSSALVNARTVVFVADSDGNLTTPEVFPANREIKMRITTSVRSTGGAPLVRQALAATTVGADTLQPELATAPPPLNTPVISPGNGQTDVDPLTTIQVEFTEPVQPLTLGSFPGGPVQQSSTIAITFGPNASTVNVPFTLMPVSVFDLATYVLTPAFNFPGEGPDQFQCGVYNQVTITVNPGRFTDLAATPNTNLVGANTNFTTGEGPGLVNAPVSPDVIYVGRSGAIPGLSVIDLNGFGQGTGNPTYDAAHPAQGNSNFPNNPNVNIQGASLRPSLQAGTCTINGGSAGVYTLALDSSLNDLLVRPPLVTSVGDTMIGHPLDTTFNDGPFPFGCQSGGGNLCAFDGNKLINPYPNGNSMIPVQNGQVNGTISPGAENLMSWAPHPNPPPLIFPPLCISPYIGGQEPTSIDSSLAGLVDLLGPGDPFGSPLSNPPIPPTGILSPEQNSYFEGPSLPAQQTSLCRPYMMRQQIGNYLYVIDRGRREIVVLNSNRMTILDRIPTQDPTTLAMSPNLNLLAVVNQTANLVSFIDIDPLSSTFHQVVQETIVGERPRGVAWEPGNEDILVCNESDNTMSIISAASLQVRKVVRSQLSQPFDIAITPRQAAWGYFRNVYFGYVLNRNGRIAVFESGPNTVNGWGYDDIIGIVESTFLNPKAIQPDHTDLRSAVWIAHEGPIDPATGNPGPPGVAAVSKLVIDSALGGVLILNFNSLLQPQFRDMHLGVQVSVGPPQLSGIPVDIAFDDFRNWTGLPNYVTAFSVGAPVPINGKQLVRQHPTVGIHPTNTPRYMFLAIPNPTSGTGVIDVVRIDQSYVRNDTNPFVSGIQSIPAENCQVVADFFRQ